MRGDYPLKNKNADRSGIEAPFSLASAIVGLIPVIFFIVTALLLGSRISSSIFNMGAFFCIVAAVEKGIKKIRMALNRKEVDFFNTMFPPLIILGLSLMTIGVGLSVRYGYVTEDFLERRMLVFPAVLFLSIGIAGLLAVCVLLIKRKPYIAKDSARFNWIFQIVHSLAQFFIFLGVFMGLR